MTTAPTAATRLAAEATALAIEGMDDVVMARTLALFTDFLAVAIGGVDAPSSRSVRDAVDRLGTSGTATVLGTSRHFAPPHAALANGAAAHALEMDDTFQAGSIHLGASVFPAVLAAAALGPVPGRLLLGAAAAGYEVGGRLAMALDPGAHYARGFHPTGTAGVFAAATAAALALGLDAGGVASAIGVAGSQAAGSMEFLGDGAWTKRLHPGWAALGGLHAAALAAAGFQAPRAILDGRFGTLRAYTDGAHPERLEPGDTPVVLRTSVKPHACCRYVQGPIDAVLTLRARHAMRVADVARIEVGVVGAAFPIVCEPLEAKRRPASVVDAQFSLPFGVAVALTDGTVGPDRFAASRWDDDEVRRVMDHVVPVRDPALDVRYPDVWPSWVRLRTTDGHTLEERIDHPAGDPERFLGDDELHAKLRQLAGRILDGAAVDRLTDRVVELPRARDVDELLAATTVT